MDEKLRNLLFGMGIPRETFMQRLDDAGYVIVPREPTEAMDKAARDECHRMSGVIDPVMHIWDRMIEAAGRS